MVRCDDSALHSQSIVGTLGAIWIDRQRHSLCCRNERIGRKKDPSKIHDVTLRVTFRDVFGDSLDSVTGTEFWTRIANQVMYHQSMTLAQMSRTLDAHFMSYEDEMTMMSVDPKRESVTLEGTHSRYSPAMFGLNRLVATYFGLVEPNDGGGWALGPNSHYEGVRRFDGGRPYRMSYWPRETDMEADDSAITERQNLIYFSRFATWTFGNINRTFGEAAKIQKARSVLVYCDLVQSTLVGNQKHALLREEEADNRWNPSITNGCP